MAANSKIILLNYSDHWSTLMLWWKAFFLMPIWAYPAILFLGSIVSFFGAAALQVTYVTVILASIGYFINDMLKRKIRLENGIISQGFRCHQLSKLLSLGTDYRRNEVLPKKMVLTFSEGKSMHLKLSRLAAPDYQKLLRFIETNYPTCQVDPVLSTLLNCKKNARKVLVDDSDKFIIEYKSEQMWRILWQSFLDTATPWLRFGPIFISLMFSGLWLGAIGSGLIMNRQTVNEAQTWTNDMTRMANSVSGDVFRAASSTGDQIVSFMQNPLILAVSLASLFFIIFHAIRAALKPNSIVIDKDGMNVTLSVFGNSFGLKRIEWKDTASVGLLRESNGSAKIQFQRLNNKKQFDLNYTSVLEEDRPRLVRAMQRFAPECTIDADLNQAMMPKHERSYTELWLQSLSTPAERNSLQTLEPGRRLQHDRYTVVRRLGVGGQGTAYLCNDDLNGKTVVLKETVVPLFADRAIREQTLKRFEQEAKLLQTLDSDRIVRLEDYFFEDHRGYLVLEHVQGPNLRELVQQTGVLSEGRARELAEQMCEILEYLHEHKIVHRDFTPDNLMLNHDGKLKLIDFNVAQFEQTGTTGTIAGKHAYLPPEQFRGKATSQSDIYAMGATLYFLISGTDPEPITQSNLRESNADVSDSFNSLVQDCTALDCNKRCASVATVLVHLHQDAIAKVNSGSAEAGGVIDITGNGIAIDTNGNGTKIETPEREFLEA